jgi:hypothetical protein
MGLITIVQCAILKCGIQMGFLLSLSMFSVRLSYLNPNPNLLGPFIIFSHSLAWVLGECGRVSVVLDVRSSKNTIPREGGF